MVEVDDNERLINQFNDAIQKIQRLNEDWVACKHYREHGKLIEWYWKLDSVFLELKYDGELIDNQNKQKEGGYIHKLKEISIRLNKAMVNKNKYYFYQYLIEKEALLREIQEESGMGAKRRVADEDSMEE